MPAYYFMTYADRLASSHLPSFLVPYFLAATYSLFTTHMVWQPLYFCFIVCSNTCSLTLLPFVYIFPAYFLLFYQHLSAFCAFFYGILLPGLDMSPASMGIVPCV